MAWSNRRLVISRVKQLLARRRFFERDRRVAPAGADPVEFPARHLAKGLDGSEQGLLGLRGQAGQSCKGKLARQFQPYEGFHLRLVAAAADGWELYSGGPGQFSRAIRASDLLGLERA